MLLVVVAAAADQLLTPEQREVFDVIKAGCIEETGVDAGLLEKYKNRTYVADEKFKCFAACSLKSAGVMKPSGAVNKKMFAVTLKKLLPAKVVEELKTCVSEVGENACETGGRYLDCMKDKTSRTLL